MSQKEKFWEAGYSNKKLSTMGGPSVEVIEVEKMLPRNSVVLDLGCGDGRNAVYMASQGHQVTAIDLSENAIDKIRTLSDEYQLGIRTMVGNVADYQPVGDIRYDAVLAHCSLHFIRKDQWKPLLKKIKSLTKPGGFHNLTSIITTDDYPIPSECAHANSFERGDLDAFYDDWTIIRSDFYAKWDKHPNIPVHVHAVEKFVARCPGNAKESEYTVQPLQTGQSIERDRFEKAKIGMTEEQLIAMGFGPEASHTTEVDKVTVGATAVLQQKYKVEDWMYGTYGLQLINNELRGKYHYMTPPVKVVVKE